MKRTCEYCGKIFNGLVELYDHKRDHPQWVKHMKEGIDRLYGLKS